MTPAALSRGDTAHYVGLSLSTWEKLVREGKAPQPRQLSDHRAGWLRRELDDWLDARPISNILPGPTA